MFIIDCLLWDSTVITTEQQHPLQQLVYSGRTKHTTPRNKPWTLHDQHKFHRRLRPRHEPRLQQRSTYPHTSSPPRRPFSRTSRPSRSSKTLPSLPRQRGEHRWESWCGTLRVLDSHRLCQRMHSCFPTNCPFSPTKSKH